MFGPQPWPLLRIRSLVLVNSREVAHISTHLAHAWASCVFLAGRSCIWKRQQLFKSIMGPSLVMLSLTSVKGTLWPGKGHTRWPLVTGLISVLGIFERDSVQV